jgi:hypothetical protein
MLIWGSPGLRFFHLGTHFVKPSDYYKSALPKYHALFKMQNCWRANTSKGDTQFAVSLSQKVMQQVIYLSMDWTKKLNYVAFSPQANYTDWATAACRRSSANFCG